jgi:hypothetical protein
MSQTALIPTFAATTLLLGSFNELSVWLTLVGILGIILHTAITPTGLPGPYPNFNNYSTEPPIQDLLLVFGLASLALVALFSRVRPLVGGLIFFIYIIADFSLPSLVLGSRSVPPQVAGTSFPHSHV